MDMQRMLNMAAQLNAVMTNVGQVIGQAIARVSTGGSTVSSLGNLSSTSLFGNGSTGTPTDEYRFGGSQVPSSATPQISPTLLAQAAQAMSEALQSVQSGTPAVPDSPVASSGTSSGVSTTTNKKNNPPEATPETKTNGTETGSSKKPDYASIGIPQNERTKRYLALAEKYARKYAIPVALVAAQIMQESGFNAKAGSYAGAQGLMQLMPDTARSLGCKDPWDPEQNIAAGCRYLKQMYDMFGSWKLALAAYNAGPGAVEKYNGIPNYRETRNYADIISKNYKKLTGQELT